MIDNILQMNFWLISIVHVISTCTATKILYVLPDNVSDVNCPSQPCATLGQYLLDNGSLPVLSDVEYYFLPGEHHVVNVIDIVSTFNFSLIGFGMSPAKLVCLSQTHVSVLFSCNVTIKNLVFIQCNGNLFTRLQIDIAAGLFLHECSYCKVEDIYFFGYGFAGINLLLKSYLNNITIDVRVAKRGIFMCSPKFSIMFAGEGKVNTNDSLLINKISISGYIDMCDYEKFEIMHIQLLKDYSMHVELCNSRFYNAAHKALYIRMMNINASSLLIRNCNFTDIKNDFRLLEQIVYGELANTVTSIRFENCKFYNNNAFIILKIEFSGLCIHPSNITIENCDFIGNNGGPLYIYYLVHHCKANVLLNETINFDNNKIEYECSSLLRFGNVAVNMNGTMTVLENEIMAGDIILFYYCDITFTKTITFLSNICDYAIVMISKDLLYIKVMNDANITFINTTYHVDLIIGSGFLLSSNVNVYPYCIFQYMAAKIGNHTPSEWIGLYTINFSGNKIDNQNIMLTNYMNDFLTHCNWLPTAVFKGHNPRYINQQIVQVDGHQWTHHKEICYCPHDGDHNCTVDLLGPVYPGQLLQVELCMPKAHQNYIINAVTHGVTLPKSACKLAHQTEFVSSIGIDSKTFNFTVISAAYGVCELFLACYAYGSDRFFRDVFYVQLSPCPTGFTLQNEVCDCDPFLPPHIDTCYIDLSAIRLPANTWITAQTITSNTTNYLISDCPMDYCLPYTTTINLAHPDLQCQFNRTGILCSQCQHPLSMVFASSRCMKCTNVHILITIIVIVAGIVLVVLLYVLNLTVTNGTINGIIFYANIVSINDSVFLVNDNVFKPLRVFISFINLDMGIETCFYNGMDSYAKMWLQLFFPSYLIIIAISIIIASRYSSRMLRLTYSKSLPVLATLFLLSYNGVLRVTINVLFSYSTITDYPSGNKQVVWSVDASVPLFGLKFTILFIVCLFLFLLLSLFNITLLFSRHLSRLKVVNYFKPLLDAFERSYKGKYYYWIAVHMILRSTFFSLYVFQLKLRLILANIILVIFTSYYGYLQPNKNKVANFNELSMLVNLTITYAVSVQDNEKIFSVITNSMMCLVLVQFGIIVVSHFFGYTCHIKCSIKEKLMILLFK